MKRQYIIPLLMLLAFAACEALDVEPYHSIPAEEAIESREDVESAITGTYSALQAVGYYGRNFLVAADLTADNLTWTGTTAGYNQMDNNTILADNVIVEGIWRDIYRMISRTNYTIAQIPSVDDLSEAEAGAYIAELRFLRAMGHFDLVRLFGPVPVRTAISSAEDDDLNVPREPVTDVYDQIFDDLDYAKDHIRQERIFGKASLVSVRALEARVNLYYYEVTGQEDYLEAAASAATQVIEDPDTELETTYADLFKGSFSNESIFEVNFTEQDRNRLAEYFFPTSLSGRREFAPTEKLYNAFESADERREASIGLDGDNYYCIKYNDIETGTDNVYVLRLAEMYLIRAEANVIREVELELAREDINRIRLRARLPEILTTSPFLLMRQVADMRQLEFAFEGHRWFDLVRTGMAIEELEGVEENYQTRFPIPLGELLTNFHEDMYQNEGY
ncbi:MAG: RagB/SusD family nutrient uptake outer membrane protein [Bacteroidales bacterium]